MDETVCPGCAKELEALRKQVAELTKELDEAASNCVMYRKQLDAIKHYEWGRV